MKEIETVAECCPHEDCVYRLLLDSGRIPICFYAVMMGHSRGCKISECDKYRRGTRHKKTTADGITWIIDYE